MTPMATAVGVIDKKKRGNKMNELLNNYQFLTAIPPKVIWAGLAFLVIIVGYTIYKRKKEKVPTYFEKELGDDFHRMIKQLKKTEKKLKGISTKDKLKTIVRISKRIYCTVASLSNQEINQKLNQKHIDQVYVFVKQQLPLTYNLAQQYAALEEKIIYIDANDKVLEENETSTAIKAIEYEMDIVIQVYSALHDDLELAVNRKRARLIKKRTGDVQNGKLNMKDNQNTSIHDVQATIIKLNNIMKQNNIFKNQ